MASRSVPNYPPNPQQPVPRRGLNPWFIRLPLLFVTGSILLVLVLSLFLLAFQLRFRDTIYPGVSALGMPLSGMTIEEATATLETQFSYGSNAVFTFRDGDNIWQMTAADLGVGFDAAETANQAFAVGHDNNPLLDMPAQADAWFTGRSISPVITYDQNVAVAQFEAMAAEINRESVNASLALNGAQVVTTESQTGRRLDIGATMTRLNEVIMRLDTGAEIALVINETPPLVSSVATTATQIQTALSAPVRLTATDQIGTQLGPWTVTVDQIAALLSVHLANNGDGTQSYTVDIDMGAFENFLAQLAPGLITPPRDGRFEFNDATGQLEVIQPASSGRTLNVAETLVRLEEGVFTPDNRLVPMAFDYTLPRYHNQITGAELGIRELVAESTTYYTGSSQNRRTNIAVSASKFNGLIIGPGEEFSFNTHLGEISYENGFVDGLVIFSTGTATGIGGGVCQVSTTVFRAAFEGGFAITERNSHGYRVGYYELDNAPPGLDAAIWQPERDFRFQNNTPHHLLIETSIMPNDNALQFRFYSTQHWRAELEDPIIKALVPAPGNRFEANSDLQPGEIVQVDFSAEGADVTVYRNIYDMQGNLVREDHEFTHYLPWQAVFQVAPGDARLRG